MAIRRILTIDNPADLAVLKQVSTPVGGVDDNLRALMDDMLETMYAAPGIGLAAVQIGDTRRVIVMDLGDKPGTEPAEDAGEDESEAADLARRNPRYIVNPEITWASDELFLYEEGCLSVPGLSWEIVRPKDVHVVGRDLDGNEVSIEATELAGRMFQHELDHLDGVLLVERLDEDQAKAAKRQVRDLLMGFSAEPAAPRRGLSLR